MENIEVKWINYTVDSVTDAPQGFILVPLTSSIYICDLSLFIGEDATRGYVGNAVSFSNGEILLMSFKWKRNQRKYRLRLVRDSNSDSKAHSLFLPPVPPGKPFHEASHLAPVPSGRTTLRFLHTSATAFVCIFKEYVNLPVQDQQNDKWTKCRLLPQTFKINLNTSSHISVSPLGLGTYLSPEFLLNFLWNLYTSSLWCLEYWKMWFASQKLDLDIFAHSLQQKHFPVFYHQPPCRGKVLIPHRVFTENVSKSWKKKSQKLLPKSHCSNFLYKGSNINVMFLSVFSAQLISISLWWCLNRFVKSQTNFQENFTSFYLQYGCF